MKEKQMKKRKKKLGSETDKNARKKKKRMEIKTE